MRYSSLLILGHFQGVKHNEVIQMELEESTSKKTQGSLRRMKNLEIEQDIGEEEKATHTLQNLQRVTLEYSRGLISICLG